MRMGLGISLVNASMLLGLVFFVFNLLWGFVLILVYTFQIRPNGLRAWPIHVAYLAGGGFLAVVTASAARMIAAEAPGGRHGELFFASACLLALYLAADQVRWVWFSHRKNDLDLQQVVRVQHGLAAVVLAAGILAMLLPGMSRIAFPGSLYLLRALQQALFHPVLGIFLGAVGVVYELRLAARLIKFCCLGKRGLPPFSEG